PVPGPITLCLMRSLKNPTICSENEIRTFLPFKLLDYKEAIVRAMSREEQDWIATRWSDAYPPAHELAMKLHELKALPAYHDSYHIETSRKASSLYKAFCQVGGKSGWFNSNWMWRLRGVADRILFGVGMTRGRRSSSDLRVNDVIDFWRVEDLQENKRLLLRAEMKVPGKAWLEFQIEEGEEKNRLTLTAHFDTHTLFGRLYWYSFLPFHYVIFKNLLKQIEKKCDRFE
ncbi:MAG: SDR family oxidoreductase, partial [Planctomycetota bacterium]